jgi:hypothetical protein
MGCGYSPPNPKLVCSFAQATRYVRTHDRPMHNAYAERISSIMMGPEDDNDRGGSGAEFETYYHNGGSNKSNMDCPSIKDDKRESEKVRAVSEI